jgi:hypothetical protein
MGWRLLSWFWRADEPAPVFTSGGPGRVELGTYRHRTAYGIDNAMWSPKDPESAEIFERDCTLLLAGRGTIASMEDAGFEEGDGACAVDVAASVSTDGLKWSVKLSGGTEGVTYRYGVVLVTTLGERIPASGSFLCANAIH